MMRFVAIGGALLGMLSLSACGSSSGSAAGAAAKGHTFTLREWTISAPSQPIPSGRVTLTAENQGGDSHELVIVKASPSALATKADGSLNEDAIAETQKMGEIEHIAAQAQKSKEFDLPAGNYVAFCNVVEKSGTGMGSVHYALGMHTTFTVK
jgi:hypothetical protein